ncbi:hypothetical protein CLV35_0249 [Motilibacter peucedani]|uniref:GIY-YIG domain-containing protein n=1 Tax=Motilibacter peucedani TaxID=598650 RepID=A0A420XV84_9ACTN|nr:hypothetical protein [Motilibacter peucedani]RKS80660.1 hypothetical protein CLV35_0249 [Motilibacter peucedani]
MANPTGPCWSLLLERPRTRSAELTGRAVPTAAGVYAWFHLGEPVYVGMTGAKGGLRGRLGRHRGAGRDLSRSSLRRNVAAHLLGIPTTVSRQRPSVVSEQDADVVTAWIRDLEVAWVEQPDAAAAAALEHDLLAEWQPPLNRAGAARGRVV